MKAVMIVLGGSVLAVTTFVGGMVSATALWTTRTPTQLASANVTELWTTNPVKIDRAAQYLERTADRSLPVSSNIEASLEPSVRMDIQHSELILDLPEPGLSGGARATSEDKPQEMTFEHLEWCASRYRSYRPRDNSFTPFSGGRRQCNSPYQSRHPFEPADARTISEEPYAKDPFEELSTNDIEVSQQVAGVDRFSPGDTVRVQSCFARYRSYRVNDNTYQPVSGGPRRQCR